MQNLLQMPYLVPAIRPARVGYRIFSQQDFKAPPPGVCLLRRGGEVGELTLKLKDRWWRVGVGHAR